AAHADHVDPMEDDADRHRAWAYATRDASQHARDEHQERRRESGDPSTDVPSATTAHTGCASNTIASTIGVGLTSRTVHPAAPNRPSREARVRSAPPSTHICSRSISFTRRSV